MSPPILRMICSTQGLIGTDHNNDGKFRLESHLHHALEISVSESMSLSAARTLSLPAGTYLDVLEAIKILAEFKFPCDHDLHLSETPSPARHRWPDNERPEKRSEDSASHSVCNGCTLARSEYSEYLTGRLYKAATENKLEVRDAFQTQVKDVTKYSTPFWFARAASIHRDHLISFCEFEDIPITQSARFAKKQKGKAPAPGKLPRPAIGKLAVEAAWEIELETTKIASALAVMERLRAWVEKREGDCLTGKTKHGVTWMTTKLTEKTYDLEACRKTLKTWHESRN